MPRPSLSEQPNPPASHSIVVSNLPVSQQPVPPASPQHGQTDLPGSLPVDQPNPTVSHPQQPNPPASQLNPSVSQTGDGVPQPSSPPPLDSSTTIVLTPPPQNTNTNTNSDPTDENEQLSGRPSPISSPPVITLAPSIPGDLGQIITLMPIPQSPSTLNPQDSGASIPGSVIVIGTQTLTPGSSIIIGGTTSTLLNGQTTVLSGTPIVLDPSGTQAVFGGTVTIAIPSTEPHAADPAAPPVVFTVDSNTITVLPKISGAFIIGSQTLAAGSVITIGGTTSTLADGATTVIGGSQVSLASGAGAIVVGSSTISITSSPNQRAAAPVVVTLGGTTLTANSATQFIFGSSTLRVGGSAMIVSGTTYSLAMNEQGTTVLIVGTPGARSTAATVSAKTSGFSRPSGTITRAAGGSGSPSGSEAVPGKTGAAVALRGGAECIITVVLVAVLLG
jgi:hypothetical protein